MQSDGVSRPGRYLRFVVRFVVRLTVRLTVRFVARFVDALAVVFGFDLTVLRLTVLRFAERPPIAARPRFPELGFVFPGTYRSSSFRG
jgi:hypothetical protein